MVFGPDSRACGQCGFELSIAVDRNGSRHGRRLYVLLRKFSAAAASWMSLSADIDSMSQIPLPVQLPTHIVDLRMRHHDFSGAVLNMRQFLLRGDHGWAVGLVDVEIGADDLQETQYRHLWRARRRHDRGVAFDAEDLETVGVVADFEIIGEHLFECVDAWVVLRFPDQEQPDHHRQYDQRRDQRLGSIGRWLLVGRVQWKPVTAWSAGRFRRGD